MNYVIDSKKPIIHIPRFQMHHKSFSFRSIRNRDELMEVYRLTYKCYLQKGYCSENESKTLIHYPQFDELEETSIFVVQNENNQLVGTISTTRDNPHGLHVDVDFHEETDLIRRERTSMASSWRIAVDEEYRHQAQVAKLLIDGSVAYWHTQQIETCLMSFHPRHERFYERYANCKLIGKSEWLKDIHSSAILMRWDANRCPLKKRLEEIINKNKVRIH